MDRRETLVTLATEYLQERFEKDLTSICEASVKYHSQLCGNLFEALHQLFKQTQLSQDTGQKAAIAYISFSQLQSNVLLNKFAFHIAAYDERFYLDGSDASVEWDFSQLIQNVDTNFEPIARILRKTETRVQEYEILELKRSYQIFYYPVVLEFLPQFVQECLIQMPRDTAQFCQEVVFTFGKYMEKQMPFYIWRPGQ